MIRRPLVNIRTVNCEGTKLDIQVRGHNGVFNNESFRFPTFDSRVRWERALEDAQHRTSKASLGNNEPPKAVSVVFLKHRPSERFQLLGTPEATGRKKASARAALILHAAIQGADAVVDFHEERIPGPKHHLCRASGMAIRAVDERSREQLKARWFGEQVMKQANLSLALILSVVVLSSFVLLSVFGFSTTFYFCSSNRLKWLLRSSVGSRPRTSFAPMASIDSSSRGCDPSFQCISFLQQRHHFDEARGGWCEAWLRLRAADQWNVLLFRVETSPRTTQYASNVPSLCQNTGGTPTRFTTHHRIFNEC